ncbi:MAG: acyl carrier protein [Pseudomonadota bacterium]|nr:acyl carrier protein [Pseudomonadota bacterium]
MDEQNRLHTILSRILKIDLQDIEEDMKPQDLKLWDSFNTMQIILEMEQEFDIQIDLEQIIEIKSIKDFEAILKQKNTNIS